MFEVIFLGIITGIGISVPIGPANLELVKRGLTQGYRKGFEVGLGTAISDSLLCLLVYMGIVPLILKIGIIQIILYTSGGFILLTIGAYSLFQTYSLEDPLSIPEKRSEWAQRYENMNPILLGLTLNSANPMVIGFWIIFISEAIEYGKLGESFPQLFIFATSVFVGSCLWFASLTAFICWGKKYVSKVAFIAISTICNVIMIICGIVIILNVFKII